MRHLVRVPVECVKLRRQVPQIPQSDRLIRATSRNQVFIERVEVDAVDLGRVRLHLKDGCKTESVFEAKGNTRGAHASFKSYLLCWVLGLPLVPHEEHLVVADRCKAVGARVVPDNILNNIGVALERRDGIYGLRQRTHFSSIQSRHTSASTELCLRWPSSRLTSAYWHLQMTKIARNTAQSWALSKKSANHDKTDAHPHKIRGKQSTELDG